MAFFHHIWGIYGSSFDHSVRSYLAGKEPVLAWLGRGYSAGLLSRADAS